MQIVGMPILARTIVEDDSVVAVLDTQCKLNPRVEELWCGWTWRLARDPETDSVEIHPDGLRLIKSDPQNKAYGLPTMVVAYTFNDKEVVIHKLRFT